MTGSRDTELSSAAARQARQARLTEAHATPLVPFVEGLRAQHPNRTVPWFDPADGGAEARVLFLLEKPSRGSAEARSGPAFISMDNPTSGARRMKALMAEAGVRTAADRRMILVWNSVPWWNGKVAVTAAELRDGEAALADLLALLPALRSVCLVGRKAETVWSRAGTAAVPVFVSAHYSANVRAAFPDRWMAIPGIWREAVAAGST